MLYINQIRKSKNITLEQLAAKTGLSKRMIIDYEKDIKDIPLKKLQLIATVLEVTIFELFGAENTINNVVKEVSEEYNSDLYKNLQDLIKFQREKIEELEKKVNELSIEKKPIKTP